MPAATRNHLVTRTAVTAEDSGTSARLSKKAEKLMKVPTHDIKDAFEDLIEHFEPIIVRYSLHGEEVLCLPESLDIFSMRIYNLMVLFLNRYLAYLWVEMHHPSLPIYTYHGVNIAM